MRATELEYQSIQRDADARNLSVSAYLLHAHFAFTEWHSPQESTSTSVVRPRPQISGDVAPSETAKPRAQGASADEIMAFYDRHLSEAARLIERTLKKCAYCEAEVAQTAEVEHYTPNEVRQPKPRGATKIE